MKYELCIIDFFTRRARPTEVGQQYALILKNCVCLCVLASYELIVTSIGVKCVSQVAYVSPAASDEIARRRAIFKFILAST